MSRNYLQQFLIAIDQVFNTLLAGWADETLSSRAYRSSHKIRWYVVMKFIDALCFWQKEHCKQAYISELERNHLPRHFRNLLEEEGKKVVTCHSSPIFPKKSIGRKSQKR